MNPMNVNRNGREYLTYAKNSSWQFYFYAYTYPTEHANTGI